MDKALEKLRDIAKSALDSTDMSSEFQEKLLDDFYENHLPRLISIYESQEEEGRIVFKYVSVEEFLEAYTRLPGGEVEEFYSFMSRDGIRVDTEACTRLLKNPIARITQRRPLDKWMKANCDAGFEEIEGGGVICVGAVVFTCPMGKVKWYQREQFVDVDCPGFAEFKGLELTITKANVRRYTKLLIEMDCNRVVNALRGGNPFPTKRWDSYRNLPLKSLEDYEICHVPREGNQLADLLVQITKLEIKNKPTDSLWKKFKGMLHLPSVRKPIFKVNTNPKAAYPHNPLGIIWKRLSLDVAMKLAMKLKQGKLRV